jgi:LacI family transcriptional regulator
MSRRPTSRDVAEAAGVSQSTVSIVLAGKWTGRVSPHTAGVVRQAAERLGYRPNLAARNLRLGQTRTVLFVVPTLTSPFFGAVYTGAARVAAARGFGVVVYPWPDKSDDTGSPLFAGWKEMDGLLASSMVTGALADLAAAPDELPLVMLDSDPDGAAPTVNLDVAGGMRALVSHLAEQGHRRFGHIAADVDAWTFQARGDALGAAVAEVTGARLVRYAAPITVAGARAVATTMLRAVHRPTALLCDDDLMAAGAYKAVRDVGLDIPGDVSVTGFDDIMLAQALEPELTTVRLPAEALGERAMTALVEMLDGHRPRYRPLTGDLVVRGSTAPPRAT